MTLSHLNHVAHYNAKLLVRSWLFRLFFLLVFCGILFIQILQQSNLINYGYGLGLGKTSLASFMPYLNAYWFTILQLFPILFLAGTFLNKDRKLDSMDTIYYRPASNAEYIWGICWGFVRVFFWMAVLSLLCSVLLHLFASTAPFNGWIYLFYLITMILPAMVFMLGFSFLVITWVKSSSLNILLLLGYLAVTLFYISDVQQGLFDPFGITLPNAFSNITGHPDLLPYLLQRGCWFFIGLGCVGLTVARFKRLPNHPRKRKQQAMLASLFFAVGLFLGVTTYSLHQQKVSHRSAYTESYHKVEKEAKMTLLSQHITYKQHGSRMTVTSRFTVQNQTAGGVREVLLYLNPALKVTAILNGGKELSYSRDNQVIRLQQELAPGESRDLEMNYEGGIDAYICYLDIPDEVLWDMSLHASGDCRYGKKYAFLTTDFTFLTPECLWYPVTVPPVNPNSSYDIPKNFTRYTLEVEGEGNKTVISQGSREMAGDKILFQNEHPLHGISLCIGDYEKRALAVDSTTFELYLFKGHSNILDGLEILQDTLAVGISDIKSAIELRMGKDYPFHRLAMVEIPVTLATYLRNERGGSEFVQPEMVYLSERGVGRFSDYEQQRRTMQSSSRRGMRMPGMAELSEKEQALIMVRTTLQNLLVGEYEMGRPPFSLLNLVLGRRGGFSNFFMNNNMLDISPLFFNYTTSIQSAAYPIMDPVLNLLLRRSGGTQSPSFFRFSGNSQEVMTYLNQYSLKDALLDTQIKPNLFYEALKLKSMDVANLFAVSGVPSDSLIVFLKKYTEEHLFQQVDFAHLNEAFRKHYGLDWMDVLPAWYTGNRLPVYWIKDFSVKTVGDESQRRNNAPAGMGPGMGGFSAEGAVVASFAIYNDSDADGVITLSYTPSPNMQGGGGGRGMGGFNMSMGGPGMESVSTSYLVKARTGIKVAMGLENRPLTLTLNTNISQNIPAQIDISRWSGGGGYTQDTAQYVQQVGKGYFLEDPDEVIVDNDDAGFQINDYSSRFKLREWFRRSQAQGSKYREGGFVVESTDKWSYYIDGEAHGSFIRSVVVKSSGKGNASIAWNTPLERAGMYEVFVSSSSSSRRFGGGGMFGRQGNRGGRGGGSMSVVVGGASSTEDYRAPVWNQYYTVFSNDGEEEVVVDVYMKSGWLSLGKFYYTPGEYKVSLSDKGIADQTIIGDAVKWVYLGDKKE